MTAACLLGLLLGVWLPSRATPVIAMVVVVGFDVLLYNLGDTGNLFAPMVTWADWALRRHRPVRDQARVVDRARLLRRRARRAGRGRAGGDQRRPGLLALAVTTGLLPRGWTMVDPQTLRPTWEAAQWRWLGLAVLATGVLVAALEDPAGRPGRG